MTRIRGSVHVARPPESRLGGRHVGDVAGYGEAVDGMADDADADRINVDGGDLGASFGEMAGGLRAEPGCGAGHHRGALP